MDTPEADTIKKLIKLEKQNTEEILSKAKQLKEIELKEGSDVVQNVRKFNFEIENMVNELLQEIERKLEERMESPQFQRGYIT